MGEHPTRENERGVFYYTNAVKNSNITVLVITVYQPRVVRNNLYINNDRTPKAGYTTVSSTLKNEHEAIDCHNQSACCYYC